MINVGYGTIRKVQKKIMNHLCMCGRTEVNSRSVVRCGNWITKMNYERHEKRCRCNAESCVKCHVKGFATFGEDERLGGEENLSLSRPGEI